jgi:hypothetical protein
MKQVLFLDIKEEQLGFGELKMNVMTVLSCGLVEKKLLSLYSKDAFLIIRKALCISGRKKQHKKSE